MNQSLVVANSHSVGRGFAHEDGFVILARFLSRKREVSVTWVAPVKLIARDIFDIRPYPMDALLGTVVPVSIIVGIFYEWTWGTTEAVNFDKKKQAT
tara:strand:+ start:2587 stop:2877 length:291 start_codon:yes stop_codon:yes gene_type:complete